MRSDSRLVTYLKSTAIWSFRLVMAALLFMVLLVAGARIFIGCLPFFQDHLVEYLNDTLDTSFAIDQLETNWAGGSPTVSIKGLSLQGNTSEAPGFAIERLDLELDLKASLMNRAPVFTYLEAEGVTLAIQSDSDGVWSLRGVQYIRDDGKGLNLHKTLEFLQLQEHIDVTNFSLTMQPFGSEPLILDTRYFFMVKEESELRHLQTRIVTQQGALEFKALGKGIQRKDMAWSGLIKTDALDLAPWTALISQGALQLKSAELKNAYLQTAQLNLEADWEYLDGQWQLQGDLNLPAIVYHKGQQVLPDVSLSTELSLSSDYLVGSTDWKLGLKNLSLTSGDHAFGLNIKIHGKRGRESIYTTSVSSVDLAALKSFLVSTQLMPELADELFTILNPAGELDNISAQYFPDKPLRERLDLSANLNNVSVDAWKGAPSASNVNGYLKMGTISGYFDLETENFTLGLTEVFRKVWHYDSAKAKLSWDVLDKEDFFQLSSDDITLKAPEGDLSGQLRLDIPLDGKEPIVMDLNVGMKNGDASYAPKYLPSQLSALSKELVTWLDTSIKGAEVYEGRFTYDGPLEDTDDPDDVKWGLYFDVNKARLDYHPDWPEVYDARGQIWVDNDNIKIDIVSAKLLDAKLSNVQADLALDKNLDLNISGQVAALGQDLEKLLTETPINKRLKGEAKNWTIRGDLDGSVQLMIPLEHAMDTSVDVSVKTSGAYFGIDTADVQIDDIQGALNFSTETGLSAKKVQGLFLGDSVEASIDTDMTNKAEPEVHFNWHGSVSAEGLQQWLQLDALSFLEGASRYKGHLVLGGKPADIQLKVTSDLKGMEVELPAPLKVAADQTVPFELRLNQFAHRDELDIVLGKTGQARIQFGDGFKYQSAVVLVGGKGQLPAMKPDKIVLSGQLSKLDLMPWKQQFEGQPGDKTEKTLVSQIEVRQLKIDQLLFSQETLNNLVFNLSHETGGTRLVLSSDKIDGSLMIPEDQKQPYQLNLKKLYVSQGSAKNESTVEHRGLLGDLRPSELPNADISIDSFKLGDRTLGSVSFGLRPFPDGKRIENLKINLQKMALFGDLDWTYINGQHRTSFNERLTGSGIQALQEALGISPFVSAKKTTIQGKLAWDGPPMGINIVSLTGAVRLKLENGTLQKVEGGAGALKMFGILNMEALTRRLRLDFSDLYKKGISFDRLDGVVRFDEGIITFDKPLEIDGPSSNFKLDGRVDSVTESMDMSLVVTLPLSSNLPILSVLLGSAPQVAGLIYLADMLVGKQVDQLASIRYRIRGSFDNPEVTLDQLFSSKARKPGQTEIPKRKKP
ncbi:YhdP family protein [Endozoicomonas sp. SESOKO2]|uniref:YhdP family protein n=1 Tax=Endozoicomonas sp. SESOKO2 TaxID=2828743 RepID=UPI002148AF8F|nr:YhdP family protein [Endozoicomonas sp. SESOKO2]